MRDRRLGMRGGRDLKYKGESRDDTNSFLRLSQECNSVGHLQVLLGIELGESSQNPS